MFCKYCGTKLIDDAAFCYECGKATYEQPVQPAQPVYRQPVSPVQPVQPVYQQPVPPAQPICQPHVAPQYTYTIPAQPVQQPATDAAQLEKLEKQTLTLGILGICLSILGLPGFILSVIAAKKANSYKKLTGKVDGKVRVAYRLSQAGRAIGIIMAIVLNVLITALHNGVTFNFDLEPLLPNHFSGGSEF